MRVLVTDYTWPSLDVERAVLAGVGAELVVAAAGEVAELARLAHDVDAILTCFAKVPAEVLDAAPRCRTVARYGVGLDNIDVEHATRLGMVVSNVAGYCTEEVADSALAGILALARRLLPLSRDVAGGGWGATVPGVGVRLRGNVLGLVGLGAIGRALVPRAQAVGMDVVAFSRSDRSEPGVRGRARSTTCSRRPTSSRCTSRSPTTPRGMIGAEQLATMRSTAWLVNTARGPLVDTAALVDALRSGGIGGAVLDVTDPEPLPADHPLRGRDDVVLTPHTAFASDGSLAALAARAASNVADVLRGRLPASVVNPQVLDSPALRASLADR